MSRLLALTKRELEAYFFAPVPWVLTFFFLLLTWYFFQWEMSQTYVAVSYGPVFVALDFILMFLIPLLTMNSVAEERSRNTLETLFTAPVHDWQVIVSKWLGTFSFYVTMLLPTLVYWAILAYLGREIGKPDPGPIMTAYLGALFLGGLYIAIGIFASSLTENSLMSAFLAFFILITMLSVGVLPFMRESAPGWMRDTAAYVSQNPHFAEFLKGRVDLHDVVYFVSMTLFFLFLAVRSLESRKWR